MAGDGNQSLLHGIGVLARTSDFSAAVRKKRVGTLIEFATWHKW